MSTNRELTSISSNMLQKICELSECVLGNRKTLLLSLLFLTKRRVQDISFSEKITMIN